MSYEAQSLLTLIGLIFLGVIIFVVFILWWINRCFDKLFDHGHETLD